MESHGIYVALSASGGDVCKVVATLSEGEYRRGRSGAKHGRDRICEWHGRSDRTLGRGYRGRHRNISRRVKALAYADGSQLGVALRSILLACDEPDRQLYADLLGDSYRAIRLWVWIFSLYALLDLLQSGREPDIALCLLHSLHGVRDDVAGDGGRLDP